MATLRCYRQKIREELAKFTREGLVYYMTQNCFTVQKELTVFMTKTLANYCEFTW